jgi:hypothetical protein
MVLASVAIKGGLDLVMMVVQPDRLPDTPQE